MSDHETPATDAPASEPAAETPAAPAPARTIAPTGLLTRPTDHAARPGFRSPPNANSKAQKNAPKKKK
jgi:hypothetical protein